MDANSFDTISNLPELIGNKVIATTLSAHAVEFSKSKIARAGM